MLDSLYLQCQLNGHVSFLTLFPDSNKYWLFSNTHLQRFLISRHSDHKLVKFKHNLNSGYNSLLFFKTYLRSCKACFCPVSSSYQMTTHVYESTSPFEEPLEKTRRPQASNGNLRQNKLNERNLLNNHGASLHYFPQDTYYRKTKLLLIRCITFSFLCAQTLISIHLSESDCLCRCLNQEAPYRPDGRILMHL